MTRPVSVDGPVRVSRSGPVLPFHAPVVPGWLAVSVMALAIGVMVVVAVVAVVS